MSAKRFGGAYSPKGTPPSAEPSGDGAPPPENRFRGRAASAVDVRSVLMFVFPTPLLFAAFGALTGGAPIRMAGLLAAYASLMLGAWLLREGQRAAAAYEARSVARAPAFPRKLVAAGLAGIGVFLAVMLAGGGGSGQTLDALIQFGGSVISGVVFAALTIGAHIAAFGVDPMRSKGLGSIDESELRRVADALDKAETKLKNIETLAHTLRDREIDDRVARLNASVRDMIKIVEQDPRDLSRARRYLGVYLKGAEDATRKYAENHERLGDPKLRDEYMALLTDLEGSFNRGRETLLLDDRTDLEVEIEVLRERLGQEGA